MSKIRNVSIILGLYFLAVVLIAIFSIPELSALVAFIGILPVILALMFIEED